MQQSVATVRHFDGLMQLWWPDEHETGDGLQVVPVLICAQETGQGAQRYPNSPGGQLVLAQPTLGHCSVEKYKELTIRFSFQV